VPVLGLPGDGFSEEISDVLHHRCQPISALAVGDRISDDDHHPVFAELAHCGQ
jgi:hypothetical protein